ncbi:hypothetical protein XJ32_02515 [Helicobacter bilis]|uniref:Uncharacterized protein n=1 Tax=Helicobacter bilis TaxID=37372 RepID=A0A1Q2LGU2_9HELI|nr:hypothetical protein [Helicobacter bilis]AQQ59172.1 hypothetical protein XJ32_02515 [Helicobacter bilis]
MRKFVLSCFLFVSMHAETCFCYNSELCVQAQAFLSAYKVWKFQYEKLLNNGAKKEDLTHMEEARDRLTRSCNYAKEFLGRDKMLFEVRILDEWNMNYDEYQRLCKEVVNIEVK